MGTNYYARIIPTKKRKLELLKAIEENDFDKIKLEVSKLYGNLEMDYETRIYEGGEIHLGKQSGGWKFLWNPNIYIIHNGHCEWIEQEDGSKVCNWINDPDTYYEVYPLTKQGIKEFLERPDVKVYDEYNAEQDKVKFFEEAINSNIWQNKEAWDSKSYEEYEKSKNPNWKTFKCTGEYVNMLVNRGYKMISETNSDFYSDGLRFATCTDFS